MADDGKSLIERRPAGGNTDPDAIMEAFLEAMIDKGYELYPAQEEAILELMAGKHVILNTPTGSGKSLVALALHFKALCEGKRAYYTSPIKALVSEKFFALCDDLGPENVGMMTGDASINRDAPIICCTAEILSNIALREAEEAQVDYVVMDEFHYFSDRERGVAWQVPLLTLPQARFLLMSATLGDVQKIADKLVEKSGVEVAWVKTNERPVPLDFTYEQQPIHETIQELLSSNKGPVYIVNFTQRECAEQAQSLCSVNFSSKELKEKIKEAVGGFRFDTAYGKDMKRYILHGIGLHHAGLLPKYRLLVEQLSQQGLLKVICGTDTLGVGVNIPIRSVLFAKLCKFDGEKTTILSVRDFKQIGGRAGRKGFDDHGYVLAQAPEHVIENLRMEARFAGAENDPKAAKKKKKMVKKQPPERGYVHWDEKTFEKLQQSEPENLKSSFQVSHGMLLNLLQGHKDGWTRLMQLIDDSLEDDKQKARHKERSEHLLVSLDEAGLVDAVRDVDGKVLRVVVDPDLQIDFSLNQTLSLYLVESLFLLDPASESFALDVLSLVESILENPTVILLRQVDKLKREKLNELKAAGVEYDQRMEELDKIEHPKPLREFIYNSFNEFAKKHPWVGGENIRPKSIAREMVERFMTFHDFVREYDLSRSEGLLLRHLSQTYRTLAQNVPESFHTQEVLDVVAFLRTVLQRTDTSLIEEWESMLNPSEDGGAEANQRGPSPLDILRDEKAFRAQVRAEVHSLIKALSEGDWEEAADLVRFVEDDPWEPKRFQEALAPFLEEYGVLRFDHQARLPTRTHLKRESDQRWTISQVLVDPEGNDDWSVEGEIDLASWGPGQPLVRMVRLGV